MAEKEIQYAKSFREQFTLRGVLIGSLGSLIITMSSMYVALKASSLPWPIIFVALVSMFSLKLMGKTNINEINVAHTIMSAGAMVAGGIAFTVPGIWMLKLDTGGDLKFQISLLVIALSGVILGLIFTALFRKFFIETQELPFPMGQAAAETLILGDRGGKKAAILFGAMGFSALWAVVRDWFHKIPAFFTGGVTIPGVTFGIYMSPMLMAIGYIIGPLFLFVWFIGALIGDIGIVWGGTTAGLWTLAAAAGIKSSLGIGVMVGTGFGIIVKGILPKAKTVFGSMFSKSQRGDAIVPLRWAPIVMVVLAFVFTSVLHMGVVSSIITILGVWLTTLMSAQILGQTGINPMEVFGVIVLLACKAATAIGQLEAFFVAAIVAVACGLVGDVMNDFKVGHMVRSDPKAQWFGEAIGGVIGAIVSIIVLFILFNAYGAEAFGDPTVFPAAQAGVVASMVEGIANMPAFLIGLCAGIVFYLLKLPVMTLGLGIYLPFYLSFTAFLGGLLKVIVDLIQKGIHKNKPETEIRKSGVGLIIASGLLGGEAIAGVVIALIMVCLGLGAI
ncbi:MAG TPA: OPT/YSL family transporter [Clostridiales bacterium]|nr:OPT/YSL family transporter [Clostridiales bacterium]